MTEKKRKRERSESTNVAEVEASEEASNKVMNVGLEMSADDEYEALCAHVTPIATPLASRKLAKKLYKLVRKAKKEKNYLRQGVTDVQRAIRKGERGLLVLAGNVSPIDIYYHMPGVCEQVDIAYVFTPSKEHLGLAAGHTRPTIMFLVKRHESYAEAFEECEAIVKKLTQ